MDQIEETPLVDVLVVGAGPCGATTAYFLAKGMDDYSGKQVALLDRASFPRDKFCGDAWCAPALDIMEEMNVLQQLEAQGLVQDCTSGGFVSPSGESYISVENPEADSEASDARCYAIKRKICDEAIVRAAQGVGAQLFENADCESAKLGEDQLWTVSCRDGRTFRSMMLIAADGAASHLCRSLGIVTRAPDGTASRQYIKGGTHNFKSGGVLFYPDYAIPGYVAIFRHYDDDIDVGVYLIEGGATPPENILEVAVEGVANDPFMQRLLGPDAVALERPRVATLRTGGEKRSSAKQFMAVGDAAGQTDPLTGEGIHTGMIAAKLAALTIHEMYEANDFSEQACQRYHDRWWKAFGKDFPASAIGAKMVYKLPLLLDAASVVAQNKGEAFIEDFGAAMTGVKPKTTFLLPRVSLPITMEIFRQIFIQKILRPYKSIREAYTARAVSADTRADSFNQSGILDCDVEARPVVLQASVADDMDKLFRFQLSDTSARRLYIFFASEYGFAADVAEEVAEHLFELGKQNGNQALDIRLLSLEHAEIIDWQEVDSCLFLCSTAGDGDPPQCMEAFLENISAGLDFAHINYAVLGFGDSAYPNFCATGIKLDGLLQQNEASSIAPLGKVNAENRSAINTWLEEISQTLTQSAYWKARPKQTQEDLWKRAETYFEKLSPPAPGSSVRAPVTVKINARHLIGNPEQGGTETFSISLDTQFLDSQGSLDWQPGDALGVLPENPENEVEQVIKAVNFDSASLVTLPRKLGSCSFSQAIAAYMDIKNLPAGFWNSLESRLSQADKDQLKQIHKRDQWELQDVLREFPDAFKNMEAQSLIDDLALLQARYYSIASSQCFDERHMDLAVATTQFDIENEMRVGVASHFLNRQVNVGDRLKVFVQQNRHFRIPEPDSDKACVMIGAGTGIAPYRAFLQELEKNDKNIRKHLMFFGCRHEHADFLYQDELQLWQKQGLVEIFTAFSRDQSEKIYVQDRIKEQGARVWEAIQAGDHFYICGDATHMAVDVENTLVDIICQHGHKSHEQAQALLKQMSQDQRYQKDVWV